MTLKLSPLFAAAVAVLSMSGAGAAGFGSGSSSAALGQPLDFTVPVRLESGESFGLECVAAEVTLGERRLPSGAVRAALEPVAADQVRLRVTTLAVVDEPVVAVAVSLGCPARLSRRFVVFAEPPMSPVSVPVPAFAANPPTVTPAEAPAAQSPAQAPAASSPSESTSPSSAIPSTESEASRPVARAREETARVAPRPATERTAQQRRPPRKPRVAAAPAKPAAPVSRLQLEAAPPAPQPEVVAQAMEAVARAASAAQAAASAASAAAVRIAALERTVEQLKGESKAAQDVAVQLRQQLILSQEASRYVVPLVVALLALGAFAAWLGWRLVAAKRLQREAWRTAAAADTRSKTTAVGESTQLTGATTSFATVPAVVSAPAGARWHRGTPAWPPPAPAPAGPDPWVSSNVTSTQAAADGQGGTADVLKTQPLPPGAVVDEGGARDVSIEELIDLEQQAEFFVVLGQDEAAVDLLVEHLRSTGGGSPLPYLKLLEIYRRRGEHEAYERTRTRFNHRFNAYAPEWGADLSAGRSLEDYPGVVPRLQQVWPRPLDAMAELEALLFRRSQGELFDLPAYREVLFLYSLARDLLDRKAADGGNVDFLLPVPDGTEFGATAPQPYLGLESDSILKPEERVTVPLDLDISGSERRQSLFGDVDPPSGPGAGRRGS
jgi:hypothetical protein